MEKGFERLIRNWQLYYFTIPLVYVCIFFALHQLMMKAEKSLPFRRVFIVYVISVLVLFLNLDITNTYFRSVWSSRLFWMEIETSNTVFELTEVFTFYYIFYSISNSKKKRLAIKALFLFQTVYFLFQIANLVKAHTFREYRFLGGTFSVIMLFSVLYFILSYFWEVYKFKLRSTALSPFIVCLFGYIILSVPIFAVLDGFSFKNLPLTFFIYSVHYFWLALLCVTIGLYAKSGVKKKFSLYRSLTMTQS